MDFQSYYTTMKGVLKTIPETNQETTHSQRTPKQTTLNAKINTLSTTKLSAHEQAHHDRELMAAAEELLMEMAVDDASIPMPENPLAQELQTTKDLLSDTTSELKEVQFVLEQQADDIEKKETLLATALQNLTRSEQTVNIQAEQLLGLQSTLQEQQSVNTALSHTNKELVRAQAHLKEQLETETTNFAESMELAKNKTLEIFSQATEAQARIDELSLQNDTLRREITTLRQERTKLQATNTSLIQELDDASSASEEDSLSSTSPSIEELNAQEEFLHEPDLDSILLEKTTDELSVYKDIMSSISSNLTEFQASQTPDIQGLLKALARLVQSAPK